MEITSHEGPRRSGAARAQQEAVQRAEAYLRAHIENPLRVSSLCRIVGRSERSLRDAFYSVRGISPKRWMVNERLQTVRRALSDRDSAPITVTTVATNCGFFELGRFAATYKRTFGESPSETLRGNAARGSIEHPTRTKGHPDVSTN
jgi:transcriptional regulator GlxA family with amidase domain